MAPAILEPRDAREAGAMIAEAADADRKLEIIGGGSKATIGAPHRETTLLSTGGMAQVVDYDPAELVLTVEAGARLADIEALLTQHGQMLAFEPWDFAELSGGLKGRTTIGGVVAAGLAGSRRVSAGGVRDHVLGFAAVNGRGEAFKAGGRVVKNVTGYDLSKLMAGSWGRLALLTQMTLKVLPRPAETRTLALRGLDAEGAVAAMASAMQAPADVAAASWGGGLTAIRIEGFGPSVEARAELLAGLLAGSGKVEALGAAEAEAYWSGVRGAGLLARGERPVLWRIVAPPSNGGRIVSGVDALGGVALLDWAGGLVWARMPVATDAGAVRKLAERAGGHAMLVEAPEEMRKSAPAQHPAAAGVAALSKRVRESFDPAGVFETGRFA